MFLYFQLYLFYYFFCLLFFFLFFFFFFNDTATTEIYTLSLHDALPICTSSWPGPPARPRSPPRTGTDRKSTRLNSSHLVISYAVFCLKKKKTTNYNSHTTTTRNTIKTNNVE